MIEGFTVTPLVAGLGRSQSAVGPGAHGFSSALYVSRIPTATMDVIDTSGAITPFADLSAILPPNDGPWWPTFDLRGNYGYKLFVNSDSPHNIYSIDSTGVGSLFQSFTAPDWDNDAMAFDPTGLFSGALFLTEGGTVEQSIYKVATDASTQLFASSVENQLGNFAFGVGLGFGENMYIADRNGEAIIQLAPDHVPGDPPTVFADFSAQGFRPVGLAISHGGAFGTDVMYVSEIGSGLVLRLAPDGAVIDTFMTNLPDPTGILLPQTGMFAGTMIVHVGPAGDIYLVTPDAQTGVHDGVEPRVRLAPASPNPFRLSTRVAFSLDTSQHVRLTVFDISGRKVRTLVDGMTAPGEHDAAWDGANDHGVPVETGVYFFRLESQAAVSARKVILVP